MFAAGFVHPWLLLGLAAAALPIAIHLIGRHRAPIVPFAAFDFLLAVNQQLARRERLRQLLLLLLRCAALALLAAALARPRPPAAAAAADAAPRRLALVLDASASMAYQLGGERLLDRARHLLLEVLADAQPGDAVSAVVAGRVIAPLGPARGADPAAVRAALERVSQCDGEADLGAAARLALAPFGGDGSNTALVVASDLAANSFAGAQPTAMQPPPAIRLLDAAARPVPAAALGNVALVGLRVEGTGEAADERRFVVQLHNYGAVPVQQRGVELQVEQDVAQRGFVDLAPGTSVDKALVHRFPRPGVYHVKARLLSAADDGYAADDALEAVVEVTPGVRLLAVDGEPRTTPHEDELFFVERALAALPRGDAPLAVRFVEPAQLADAELDLSQYDVVLLANVAAPEAAVAQRLRAFVEGGGGLLVGLGAEVRFEAYNAALGDLLPHPLRDAHLAADGAAGTPAVGIGAVDWEHPVLAGLGSAAEQSLRASRTRRYFNLDAGAGRRVRTLLRFDDGAPALVEARRPGAGRVMLLTTSLDVDDGDLALRTAFVALLQRTVRYLAHALEVPPPPPARVGEVVALPLPTAARGLALRSPGGQREAHVAAAGDALEAAAATLRFGPLAEAGTYRAEVQRAAWEPEPRLDLAVGASLAESDYAPVRPQQVAQMLGEHGQPADVTWAASAAGEAALAAQGLAPWLLLGLCLAFVAESLLAGA